MVTTKIDIELIKEGIPNSLLGRVTVPNTEDAPQTLAADVNQRLIMDGNNLTSLIVNPATTFDNNNDLITLSAPIEKVVGTGWIQGTGNGGLDTGALAADTWYHVHVIKDVNGEFDILISLSKLTPTLPTGWINIKRIGSIYIDSSLEIVPFIQVENHFQWTTHREEYFFSGSGNNALDVTFDVSVPDDIRCRILWSIGIRSIDSRTNVFSIRPASLPEHAGSIGGQFLQRGLDLNGVASGLGSFRWDSWACNMGYSVMENEDQMTWKFSNTNGGGSFSINSAVFYTWGYTDLEV